MAEPTVDPEARLPPTSNASDAGWTRWTILLLTCGGLFGQYYAFDNPSALNEQLKEEMMERTQITAEGYAYHFNLLYSVYSLPNIVLPLVLGMAVDRCGYRVLICVLSLLVGIGHIVFSMGVGVASWPAMLMGRVIFGLGGESIAVAQACFIFRWFKGKEVACALGLNLSVARAGSVLNDVMSPWIAARWGLQPAVWTGAILCLGSFVCNVASIAVDKAREHQLGPAAHEEGGSDDHVSFSEVFKLPKLFWLLTVLGSIMYCTIMPFNNIASAFFVETWYSKLPLSQAQQLAGNAMSLIFLVAAFGTPPFGTLIDYKGLRGHFLFSSAVLVTITYSIILSVPPPISMMFLGFVYTVMSGALWPSFALVVPQRQLGTCYGIATAQQNGSLALAPLLVGYLQARRGEGQFGDVIHLFLVFGVMAVGISIAVLRLDTKGVLELPSTEAEKRRSELEAETTPLKAQ